MDAEEFKKDFIEDAKSAAAVDGEGTCAAFVENMAEYLIESEVLPDFCPSFYVGKKGNGTYRVDGYCYDEVDEAVDLIIADYDGTDLTRTLTVKNYEQLFNQLMRFLRTALETDLYKEIEISTPCSDLVDLLRVNRTSIRRYRFFIFTDADMSRNLKNIDAADYNGIPIEEQIWDLERLFNVCSSQQGREKIEIDFTEYCPPEGVPCIEASSAVTDQYRSYLGIISGEALADIYDKYGSRLLEGNVRSFLSTKVAVNKKIRTTILNEPKMFFAYNNGISATAMEVRVNSTPHGNFITSVKDFQIINGGQTTASISNARYKDKADISDVYVQMKLTAIDESTQDEADELIRNISRSSNSQNKVSEADFYASHPFHRRMEQLSRSIYAPAAKGAQYETQWFYERARGQFLQAQMMMTTKQKKQFLLQNPKEQVIKKTDLAKVQNAWMRKPQIVSKGAQTNFIDFSKWMDDEWEKNEAEFNADYFKSTASLVIMFQYLEKNIPKQSWYGGGYRANIIYYAVSLFRELVTAQHPGYDFNLMEVWSRQELPEEVGSFLLALSYEVHNSITHPPRDTMNVTQWCKRNGCWDKVRTINCEIPESIKRYLISTEDLKSDKKSAAKKQKIDNGISAQTEVVSYSADFWRSLTHFSVMNHLVGKKEVDALNVACNMPRKIPNSYQSRILLKLLGKAKEEGFSYQAEESAENGKESKNTEL